MIREHDTVVLSRDIPEYGLKENDIGAVVHCYKDNEAFEVEFVRGDGETVAVIVLTKADLRSLSDTEILHARRIAAA